MIRYLKTYVLTIFYRFVSLIRLAILMLVLLIRLGKTRDREKLKQIYGRVKVLWRPYVVSPPQKISTYQSKKKTVLYLAHDSINFRINGYTVRTHGLVKAINRTGEWEVKVLTRLGCPFDSETEMGEREAQLESYVEIIDGISYQALKYNGLGWGRGDLTRYINEYVEQVYEYCLREKPAIIHGASNFLNGVVAAEVGNRLGIPSVYELRGLWEVSRVAKKTFFKFSPDYWLYRVMEVLACKSVTSCFVISKGLSREMNRYGKLENLKILRNAVDGLSFYSVERNQSLFKQIGLPKNKLILGYIGSLVEYEGLLFFLQTVKQLKDERADFHVLIVGEGSSYSSLKLFVQENNLSTFVTLVGGAPHNQILDYYSLIDVFVYPRMPYKVCKIVSPLKPFEAMAMGKVVIVSNLDALQEIIQDKTNGFIFKSGDFNSLLMVLNKVINSDEERLRVARNAKDWIQRNNLWSHRANEVLAEYKRLTGDN